MDERKGQLAIKCGLCMEENGWVVPEHCTECGVQQEYNDLEELDYCRPLTEVYAKLYSL